MLSPQFDHIYKEIAWTLFDIITPPSRRHETTNEQGFDLATLKDIGTEITCIKKTNTLSYPITSFLIVAKTSLAQATIIGYGLS